MKSRLFIACLAGFSSISLLAAAQDETDALRYSFLSPQATARSIGIGGALGSIGGDMSCVSVNPAGLGIYRSSEFAFTPSLKLNGATGTYINTTTKDNEVRFNFNNLGVVFNSTAKGRRYDRSKWKSVSFALVMSRLADFNRNITYGGTNAGVNSSSFSEVFVADAAYYDAINHPTDFGDMSTLTGIGWQSYLIDTFNGQIISPVLYNTPAEQRSFVQRKTLRERGGINDIALSVGGNYEDQLMFGATLGLPALVYDRDMTFEESDASNDNNNDYKSLVYSESLSTTGLGINLKLGFIYKPNDDVRFGVAFHTPTYFGLSDVQNTSITANTENFGHTVTLLPGTDIPESVFEYGLITPWRAIVSATGFLGTHGFVTADYEYVDYSSARYSMDNAYAVFESNMNQLIKSRYRGASNFRLGAEGRFDNVLVRLGFGYYGNPYTTGGDSRLSFSTGVGYRFSNWFMDLGFMNTSYQETEQPYILIYPQPTGEVPVPQATIKNSINNVALTLGWKF